MKKTLVALVLILLFFTPSFSQVDTSFIYNQNTAYGTLDLRIAKSPTRFYYLQENITFSFRESSPGVKTNTYTDMTAWDSSPYTEGNLREKINDADNFVMNYRLLKPVGYNATYDKGYPLIIMFHGSGEKGNCWNSNCYHATKEFNPLLNNPAAPTTPDHELLNNDHNLLHGGKVYLDAVNLAGNKLPNDPTLPERAFPGFVLFPQNLNGWTGNAVQDAIKIIRLLSKKYNIDENRIYVNGLSNGGHGLYESLKRAPWMFSAAIAMSAVDDGFITSAKLESTISRIPLWVFQGGLDVIPSPNKTKGYIKRFRDAGAVIRYTEYSDVGHTTWNSAYKEPDFFSWMLGENKAGVHIFAGNAAICTSAGSGLALQLPEGFKAYQWEFNGQIISGANAATYLSTSSGNYRARFSRLSTTPSETQWNDWSPAIKVTVQNPPVAEIKQIGTVLLKDLNNGTDAQLESSLDFAHYYWYKDGVLLDLEGDQDDTLKSIIVKPGDCTGSCTGRGAYTLVTSNFDNCNSAPSKPKYLFFNDQAPININAPTTFTGLKKSASAITLNWTDNSSTESGFEVWRRKKIDGSNFSPWLLVVITTPDSKTFNDENLEPSSTYQYKIRAVSNDGRSDYAPIGSAVFLEVSTGVDTTPPSAPLNVTVKRLGLQSALISWKSASDDSGILEYKIFYGDSIISVAATDSTYRVTSLAIDSTYNFTMKAVDLAANESAPSNIASLVTNVSGLFYEHSPGYWPSLDSIDFTKPEYTGFVETFTLSPKTQDDYFYFRFDGFLYVTLSGTYQFRTSSDDGSRLRLNGELLVENNGVHDLITVESKVLSLNEGAQRITVDFFDFVKTDSLRVEYKGPDTNNQWLIIPGSAFKSNLIISTEPTLSNSIIVNVYPNPAEQNNLNVQVETIHNAPIRIRLLDPVGRAIYDEGFDVDQARQGIKISPMDKLSSGIYIINVNQGEKFMLKKVIIKNQ